MRARHLGSTRIPAGARLLASGLLLAALGLFVGCSGTSRAFARDQSVQITSPAPLAVVAQPFTIAWKVAGGRRVAGDRWAVFVDGTPIAPGHGLKDMATQQCKDTPSCEPTPDYLAGIGVFVTSQRHVSVPSLVPLAAIDGRRPHAVHTATIVVVDSRGKRVGEAAWTAEFRA